MAMIHLSSHITTKCGCSLLVPVHQTSEFITSSLVPVHYNQWIHSKSTEIIWHTRTPFVVVSSQVQQVFYFNDSSNSWWMVTLHKESQNKRVFLDTYGEYINTNEYGNLLDAWGAMLNVPTVPSNVGAIFLFREKSLLLNESR